jgi:hypothetical protein
VVVPVYSGEVYLPALVKHLEIVRADWSARSAPIDLSEVILVDDSAVDGSPAILDRFANDEGRVMGMRDVSDGSRQLGGFDVLLGWAWILPAFAILFYILKFGVACPFWDAFVTAEFVIKVHDRGYPLWSELTAQVNDSRPFFPLLLEWVVAAWSGWDQRWEMVAGWAMILMTVMLLGRVARRTFQGRIAASFQLFASLFFFSIAQYANFLFAAAWPVFVPLTGLALGLWGAGLKKPAWVRVSVGAMGALVGSFSFANGLVVWVLMLPVIAVGQAQSRRERFALVGTWMLATTIVVGMFFWGYKGDEFAQQPAMVNVTKLFGDISIFVGNGIRLFAEIPQTLDGTRAVGAGAILLVMCCTLAIGWGAVRRREWLVLREAVVWLTLPAYTLMSGGAVALKRAVLDSSLAVSERYPTHGIPLFVGLFPLVYLAARSLWPDREESAVRGVWAYAGGSLVLLAVATAVNYPIAQLAWVEGRKQSRAVAMMIQVAPNPPMITTALLHDFEPPAQLLPELASRGLLHFPLRTDPYLPPVSAQEREAAKQYSALDSVWRNGASPTAVGWATVPGEPTRPANLIVVGTLEPDGRTKMFTSSHDTMRRWPNVRPELGSKCDVDCGFALEFPPTKIVSGTPLMFWIFDSEKNQFHFVSGPVPMP